MTPRNPTWERDELILALELYLGAGMAGSDDPRVVELSELLNQLPLHVDRPDPTRFRNPNGVAMKLANFAALDPTYDGVALSRGGHGDGEIWDEFADNRAALARHCSEIRARAGAVGVADAARHYWAFCASPRTYRILDAVQRGRVDKWTTRGKPVRAGDRALIWKAAGSDGRRGIVALGEVMSNPAALPDADNPCWVTPPPAGSLERRVSVRYVVPPRLPSWYEEGTRADLEVLSVCRARGGSVFAVTPAQWASVLRLAGGWEERPAEVREVADLVAYRAGKQPVGQGFGPDPEVRRAVEAYAMDLAELRYRQRGWTVQDVSTSQPYDLHCTRADGAELRVKVKGTVSTWAEVLLTPAEVERAKQHYPNLALVVVAGVSIARGPGGGVEARGGRVLAYEPWDIGQGQLTPLGYAWRPPDP